MSTMTAPKPAKLVLSKQQQYLIKWANGTQTGTGSASSEVIEKVRSFVNLIGTSPKKDYGLAKKVLDETGLTHGMTVTAGIIALADYLWELYQSDTDSFNALANSGFVTYFCQYYCDVIKLPRKTSETDLSQECNSETIGPALLQMLKKTK